MTCIVGIAKDGVVYMAGDSLGGDVTTYAVDIRKDPKVFRKGEFLIGYTTSFRMGDLLQYRFQPPPIETDLSVYMRTTFIDAVRECFKSGGFSEKEKERESGGQFMVGVRGRLFEVGNDYQVGEPSSGWSAIGSGMQIARGAIFAALLFSTGQPIPDLLRTALEAAEYCSAYVRGPFHLVSTERSIHGTP